MPQLQITRVTSAQAPAVTAFADHTVFQTDAWLAFVAETQRAEVVIGVVEQDGEPVGRFTGLISRKLGLRILGSPFSGWTTSYQGFNLAPGVSRRDVLLALEHFAVHELGCWHLEIMDRRLSVDDFQYAGYRHRMLPTYQVDLSSSEEAVFGGFDAACRRNIRKAVALGVQVEAAQDLEFADDYWSQLQDVFAKQGLVPTYGKERVCALIRHLLATGNLLLARARDSQGRPIATGIFPAANDTMYFWGGASWRSGQHLRPNEAVQAFAIRYWQQRGITVYDMGGGGAYKRKYGGTAIAVPWGRRSKYQYLETLRDYGRRAFRVKQRLLGRFKS